jgi:hypothetical protein
MIGGGDFTADDADFPDFFGSRSFTFSDQTSESSSLHNL